MKTKLLIITTSAVITALCIVFYSVYCDNHIRTAVTNNTKGNVEVVLMTQDNAFKKTILIGNSETSVLWIDKRDLGNSSLVLLYEGNSVDVLDTNSVDVTGKLRITVDNADDGSIAFDVIKKP